MADTFPRLVAPPRTVPDAQATAEWRHTTCPSCGQHLLTLHALGALHTGTELTVAACRHIRPSQLLPTTQITFDGGARSVEGRRVAGAGAALWQLSEGSWQLTHVARVPLPAEEHAQVAETWGAVAAIELLTYVPLHAAALISGDNLNIVRYCAAAGRLRRPHLALPLTRPLADLALTTRTVQWQAVPRRVNKEADSIATEALMQASNLPVHVGPAVHITCL